MIKLLFGSYERVIKAAYARTISDVDLINSLFDGISGYADISNKVGDMISVSKSKASQMANMKCDVFSIIREYASKQDARSNCLKHFKKEIIPCMKHGMAADTINRMVILIKQDPDIVPEIKKRLLASAREETFIDFLVDVYLYVLNVSNVLSDYEETIDSYSVIEHDKRKTLRIATIPDSVQEAELPYVATIQAAYRDHDKSTDESIEKSPKHSEHFGRQRKSYYTAEFLRRSSRDAYAEEEESPFDLLEEETYEGLIETWDSEYADGLARMNAVLSQAAKLSIDSSILCKETNWVTEGAKKGICHILVNEDRVKGWIKDE